MAFAAITVLCIKYWNVFSKLLSCKWSLEKFYYKFCLHWNFVCFCNCHMLFLNFRYIFFSKMDLVFVTTRKTKTKIRIYRSFLFVALIFHTKSRKDHNCYCGLIMHFWRTKRKKKKYFWRKKIKLNGILLFIPKIIFSKNTFVIV